MRARPALIQVIWSSGWQLGPETLRGADEMIGLIAQSGTPQDQVADVYYALTTFLFGFVAAEATTPGTSRYREPKGGAASFANLARYRPAADHAGMDRRFEAGIVRFVESLRPKRASSSRAPALSGSRSESDAIFRRRNEGTQMAQTHVAAAHSSNHRPTRSTRVLASIRTLGLEQHLIELETLGYTTLKGVLDARKIDQAKAAILERVERTSGKRIDP